MKRLHIIATLLTALALALSGVVGADDGAITNKNMSRTIKVPAFDQDIVNDAVSEAEHAFTDMMGFYVPAQAASGLVEPIAYCDIDNNPAPGEDCTNAVEELEVAKPLVNVFIYGPKFHVPHTAFGHSFMDTYVAVSLNDGENWKQTNLSESADQSSFNLEEDHNPSGKGSGESLPGDHIFPLGTTWTADHAKGYDTPYTAHCSECHGQGLQGVAEVPACYSCHENVWTEETPVEIGPIVYSARLLDVEGQDSILTIKGENAAGGADVNISNALTGALFTTITADGDGKFIYQEEVAEGESPCVVVAEYIDNNGDDYSGPTLQVLTDVHYPETPEPIENCAGSPLDLNEYPGGTYNVFQATAGNKTLVAWPSRFCQRGQPAYSMTTDSGLEDPDQQARLLAITNFIKTGDPELGVPALPDFTSTIDGDAVDDLYLVDAFGVAGNQGSIDFTDEGYPQAGVVPFGCVWTSRGVLLPGDDPRTDEAEASYMVWTKAERLTSGRRDPNRIEVQAVKGAGFVITWQEDPEGIRPGQGLGPGEGWSGAVAHSQTDAWYSFINEEYFDIVETVDNTTVPIDILDHDLALSGRPQVFVPMAVPMRLSNNAKCNVATLTETEDLYCDFLRAEIYGLNDNCAATVTIQTGNENNPSESEICVADTNDDGVADLPNRANTALTRPRTSLQGYDADGDTIPDSAWVVVAAEESKGLGKYFFEPSTDGLLAISCEEDSSETCTEEIGKNQWYFSFDMGTPDTSAGIGKPNSLVENLVSQGDMLNQGEVYWETGELFGLMKTLDMEDYGDFNFDILNTEIARRASILVQSVGKATASANGLAAIISWKQGTMRQGGPADTMLRRFIVPVGYGGYGCPVVDDPDGLTITSASWDNGEKQLHVGGEGADGIEKTKVLVRNAMTEDLVGARKETDDEDANPYPTDFDFYLNINTQQDSVPCAVQAADEVKEGEVVYGPWIEVENAPVDCELSVPEVCTTDGGSVVSTGIDVNPYAFENMECETFLIEPDTNPYYPGGVCADPAINLSGVVPDTCLDDDDGSDTPCPTVDFDGSTYGIGDTNPILQGVVQGEGNTQRVLTWHQCPSDYTVVGTDLTDAVDCATDDRTDDFVNLRDQSWYNPLDISKGHRGFLDGDFVQFLYAWSPTWRLNAKGNDRYDLYVRRSFDGGVTWVTTPSSFTASNGLSYSGEGTVTCESYRPTDTTPGERDEPTACYEFAAGANEHARNITQHRAMRITTLAPRYAATKATIEEGCTDGLFVDNTVIDEIFTCDDLSEELDSDLRDPSRYFMVFETGDNTTVAVGEAEPLDLFYGRAENFGDDYVVWAETDTDSADLALCYPNDPHGDEFVIGTVVEGSGFCNEFDNMNTGGDTHSSEANLESNPDGSKMYGVWAQWVFDDSGEEVVESDAMARRVWWIDDYISDNPDLVWTLPGTQQP